MSYYTSIIIINLLSLVVLSILIKENNRIPNSKKRLFIITNALIGCAAIAECAGVHISSNPNVPKSILYIFKALDYTLTPATGGALIALINKQKNKKLYIQWLFVANGIFQIVSAFTGWMIIVDDQNHYTHGKAYFVYMIIYIIVLIYLAIALVLYGKSFKKQNRLSLYATVCLAFIGILLQEILGSNIRVAYLALAFCSSYLFIHYSEFAQMELDDTIEEQQVKISIDALTGVYSRFAYNEATKLLENNIPSDLCVFLIDINGLKAINDTYGHEVGDQVICATAKCIEQTVSLNTKTYRIGGDEFIVFANMSKDQAEASLKKLNEATSSWSNEKIDSFSVSAAFALASNYDNYSIDELTREADKEMYYQKRIYYEQNGIDRRKNPRCE